MDPDDDRDVPAAVICTTCGRADCAGCLPSSRALPAATPWEHGSGPVWRRLWQTAHLATMDGEAFFGDLADGSLVAAFGFALWCELVAISSLTLAGLPLVYAMVPEFVGALLSDEDDRTTALAAVSIAVPLLALTMVVLHVLWAVSLELSLRFEGTPPRVRHCLRYALYSCGWDLVTSPFGFAAACLSGGVRNASAEVRAAVRVPRFATRAYLSRGRKVPERNARRAVALAAVVTGACVIAGAVAVAAAVIAIVV